MGMQSAIEAGDEAEGYSEGPTRAKFPAGKRLEPLRASAKTGDGGWRSGENGKGSVRTVGVLGVNVRDLLQVAQHHQSISLVSLLNQP